MFEIDVAPTQERKRAMLARAGVAKPPQLVYVTLGFETDSLAERLTTVGFDPTRRPGRRALRPGAGAFDRRVAGGAPHPGGEATAFT